MQQNPQKHSMWWLCMHKGKLQFVGSALAEQNNSSVAIHFGDGVTLDMLLNVTLLFERQLSQHAARAVECNKLHMHSQRHKGITSLNEFQKKS